MNRGGIKGKTKVNRNIITDRMRPPRRRLFACLEPFCLGCGLEEIVGILESINCPADLAALTLSEKEQLCGEIRAFLIDNVSKTGGHLASNLGIVELTVAIHSAFDTSRDRIVFDVGHQSYVHKILTGRRDMFPTLRQYGGLAGFPKTSESVHDAFNTGHSSTSISAALGLARARDLKGGDYYVGAVFGDGALTGGMMYEALSDAGHSKNSLILILNDNAISISKNVGGVSKYLRSLRISPRYFHSKKVVEDFLNKMPVGGRLTADILKTFKTKIRAAVLKTTMFEDLGITTYLGPVDGHDLNALTAVLNEAKKYSGPVFVHVMTKKGMGYAPAEHDPESFHGIGAFDADSGEAPAKSECYSLRFGRTLCEIAEKNDRVCAITGAMTAGTGLEEFSKRFPTRFYDVGIAEPHAVTMAAGLAAGGFVPVVPLYSSFLQRAYDQTLHDVCLQKLHIVFPVDRAGIVGADGETHQGIYDIAYLSHMPNMTVLSPSTFMELDKMLHYAVNEHEGPIAIRYPKGCTQATLRPEKFSLGTVVDISKGDDAVIFASGRMVKTAQDAALKLSRMGISAGVTAIPTIKPLDTEAIAERAAHTGLAVSIEDGVKIGGIGQMIGSALMEAGVVCRYGIFAFPDTPVTHGSINELDKLYGVSAEDIIAFIVKNTSGIKYSALGEIRQWQK